MRRIIGILVFALFLMLPASGQVVNGNTAFKPGEVMTFDAYFNLGVIWVHVGEATFSVFMENGNYKFEVKADNLPKWDWLYELHSHHVATATKEMKPLSMSAKTMDNGNYSETKFKYESGQVYKWEKSALHPEGKDTVFAHEQGSQDIINSVYVARNVDLTQNGGKKLMFYPIFNEKPFPIEGNVLKRERIKTRSGDHYDCIKSSATVGSGTFFDEDSPVYVWVTDDHRKIPVLVEAKISVLGTVKVYLRDYVQE